MDSLPDTSSATPTPASEAGDLFAGADSSSGYRFSRQLTVLSDPTGVQSSAVGALRNHLAQQHMRVGRRALAVCSVGSDVDRSLITANLAIAVAQAGASTMLVDANFRAPELTRYFHAPAEQRGLLQYLDGTVDDVGQIAQVNVLPNLSLISTGGLPADPQAALANNRFETLMNALMRNFDFTIVDCPPANTSSDVRRIGSVVRYALIVVKQDVTFVNDVKHLIEELTADRVSVVGTFLNVG